MLSRRGERVSTLLAYFPYFSARTHVCTFVLSGLEATQRGVSQAGGMIGVVTRVDRV
jgi:hypothetical protein